MLDFNPKFLGYNKTMSSKLRPLWTCPKCGKQFVTRNIWHSCTHYELEDHFIGKDPLVRELFDYYLGLVRQLGPITVEPRKSGIAFLARVRFAGAVTRRHWLEVSLWLKRKADHPRLRRVEKYTEHDFGHKFRMESKSDFDETFMKLLKEAYSIGIQEYLRMTGR
jgi:hypothetical protein